MSTELMIAASVAETLLLVIILVVALTRVRQGLAGISGGLTALAGALATVESQINQRFATILSVLPGIAAKAAFVVRKVTGG